ncbi:MAG TPA: cation:proton antiporter [Gemmatimonadaceae bacterium]|nr:cation:proton antiporter [Gemmatimonadaceae bacterium]
MIAALAAAAPATGEGYTVPQLLLVIAAIFAATKLFGEIALRFRQPAVLGEILAGVVLGGSALGILDPSDRVIHAMSEVGVIVLLFATGLHTNVSSLLKAGPAATAVAIAGVVLPFASGYFIAVGLGATSTQALVAGAAMCATSVGISARVLSDLRQLDTREGQVVLGAAVIDDIIGLIILAVVMAITAGGSPTLVDVARIAGIAIGFVVLAILIGGKVVTVGHKLVVRAQSSGALGLLALAFAFGLAALADRVGSAMIVGAFAAGLVLDERHDSPEIEKATAAVGNFFVPIFFASVGAMVDIGAMMNARSLSIGGALIVFGILGKVAAGWAPFWFKGNKLLIGVAMVPRGEVGLIFAQMGLAAGAIDGGIFGAIMLMVLVTTLVTPPALAAIARRKPAAAGPSVGYDSGGLDELVGGVPPERRTKVRRAKDRG